METITPDERDFLEWIVSDRANCYWDFDQNGQRIRMAPGWEKAEAEYNRINRILGLKGKMETDLKV